MAIRFRIAHIPVLIAALMALMFVPMMVTACGSDETPAAPPFTNAPPFPNTYEGLVECVYSNMEGSLTRPRSQQYANIPYLNELDPEASIVGGHLSVSDEAWQHFEGLLQATQQICGGVRTYDVSNEDWPEQKAMELQSMGILFVVPLVGLLTPDMAHNCAVWREEFRPYKDQSAGVMGVPRANEAKWQAFSFAWSTASDGIDQQCATAIPSS